MLNTWNKNWSQEVCLTLIPDPRSGSHSYLPIMCPAAYSQLPVASLLKMQILEQVHIRVNGYNIVHHVLCFIKRELQHLLSALCRFPSSRSFTANCWPCSPLRGGLKCSSVSSSDSWSFCTIFFFPKESTQFPVEGYRLVLKKKKKVLQTPFLICIGRMHRNDSIEFMFGSYTDNNYKSNSLIWHIHTYVISNICLWFCQCNALTSSKKAELVLTKHLFFLFPWNILMNLERPS